MSTKRQERCPRCSASTTPTDTAIVWQSEFGAVPWRQWRYECACGWTWTNAAQRAHNDREYTKLRKFLNQRGWG